MFKLLLTTKSTFKLLLFSVLCLLSFWPAKLQAQVAITNPISTGLGNTGAGFVGALQAVDINPARLHYFESPNHNYRLTINLFPPVGLYMQNSSIDLDLYNSLFGKKTNGLSGDEKHVWTDEDKNRLLSNMDDVFEIDGNFSISLFGISYHDSSLGTIAFTIKDKAGVSGDINKDVFVLALHGNEDLLGETLNFEDLQASSWWYREYGLSYARDITPLVPHAISNALTKITAGITLKAISGYAYADADGEGTRLYFTANGDSISGYANYTYRKALSEKLEDDSDGNASYFPFPESSGSGFGVSFGLSAEINQNISVGFALNDIGLISFNKNTEINTVDGEINFGGFSEILDDDRVEAQADSLEAIVSEVTNRDAFRVWLPAHLRLGGSITLENPFRLSINLDYVQGFNSNFGNSTTPILGIGTELRYISTLPVRTGFRFGGREGFGWTFGIGLDCNNFTIETSMHDAAWMLKPNGAKSIAFGLNMRLRLISVPIINSVPEEQKL